MLTEGAFVGRTAECNGERSTEGRVMGPATETLSRR
jgi:hypothetical protein